MTNLVIFALGALAGGWAVAYRMNRYYRSEIWAARKKILLEKLLLQEKKVEVKRTQAEFEIQQNLRKGMEE